MKINIENQTGFGVATQITDAETGSRVAGVYDLHVAFPIDGVVEATMKRYAVSGTHIKSAKVVKTVNGYILTNGKNMVTLEFEDGIEPDWIRQLFAD